MSDCEKCRFCGGTLRYRVIRGVTRPLRRTCSCPDPGGPKKPWYEDDFCRRTECRFCGQKPIYFVRHNGGSIFFDRLGQPWPKHDCLLGDDSVVARIRSAIKNSSVIRAADLYQVLNPKYLPGLKLLSLELRDTNGRCTTWHISQFEKINALTGAIVAICRISMQLIDSSGRLFIVNGPMIRCRDCEQWFLRRRRSMHRCAWSAVKISWKRADLAMPLRGHGLCVYAVRGHDRRHLAAFVERFGRYHRDEPAVTLFDPRYVPADDEQFSVLKAALERRIRARDVSASELTPGYRCFANA